MLERKYGGPFVSRRAARTIQTAFRQYRMNKNFERLRSSASESRMTRRIILSNMRMQVSDVAPYRPAAAAGAAEITSVPSGLVQYSFDERQPLGQGPPVGLQGSGDAADVDDAFSKQVSQVSGGGVTGGGRDACASFLLQVKSLADSMDDSLTCQSGREDSQEVGGEGEEDEDEEDEEEEGEEDEEEEEEDEEEDYRECSWRNANPSSRRLAGRVGGAGGRGGAGGGAAMHEDSTATSFSDVTLYMDEGCLPSSPLSRPSSSPLSRPASSSDTEYWGGGGGAGVGPGGREDSRETEGGSIGSRRSSTPCTECRGEYRGRPGGGGGGGSHLPVLTIEPPSDSSVDMSDRWVQVTSEPAARFCSHPTLPSPGRSAAPSDAWSTNRSPRAPSEEAGTGRGGRRAGTQRAERMSEKGEEGAGAAKPTPRRGPSNTSQTAAPLPRRRGRLGAPPASPCRCLRPGPCPLTRFHNPSNTLTPRCPPSLTCPPSSTTSRSTASPT